MMEPGLFARDRVRKPGTIEIAAAEKNNIPGKFTTLIGWEWTSTPGGKNLHRCVITNADGASRRSKFIPFSNYESLKPEDLWAFFDEDQAARPASISSRFRTTRISPAA